MEIKCVDQRKRDRLLRVEGRNLLIDNIDEQEREGHPLVFSVHEEVAFFEGKAYLSYDNGTWSPWFKGMLRNAGFELVFTGLDEDGFNVLRKAEDFGATWTVYLLTGDV